MFILLKGRFTSSPIFNSVRDRNGLETNLPLPSASGNIKHLLLSSILLLLYIYNIHGTAYGLCAKLLPPFLGYPQQYSKDEPWIETRFLYF